MKRFAIRLLTVIMTVSIIASCMVMGASAIELKTGIGVVQANGLRLRAKPNTNADVLANASYGDNVVIIREVDGWYLVDYNLIIGYMAKDYITFKEKENVDLGYGIVESGSVNLRAKPDANSELLATLPMGDTAYIIGLNCGWYKVQYEGQIGYIRSDLLALTEAPRWNSQAVVGSAPVVQTVGSKIIAYSQNFLGVPYVWGGTTPKGFDCSGFTQYVMRKVGLDIHRTVLTQLQDGIIIAKDQLRCGDLVFFENTTGAGHFASHIGIYLGNGKLIHAGSQGITIVDLDSSYFTTHYLCARRVILSDLTPVASVSVTGTYQRAVSSYWRDNSETTE